MIAIQHRNFTKWQLAARVAGGYNEGVIWRPIDHPNVLKFENEAKAREWLAEHGVKDEVVISEHLEFVEITN